jgi:hypothetical protein
MIRDDSRWLLLLVALAVGWLVLMVATGAL